MHPFKSSSAKPRYGPSGLAGLPTPCPSVVRSFAGLRPPSTPNPSLRGLARLWLRGAGRSEYDEPIGGDRTNLPRRQPPLLVLQKRRCHGPENPKVEAIQRHGHPTPRPIGSPLPLPTPTLVDILNPFTIANHRAGLEDFGPIFSLLFRGPPSYPLRAVVTRLTPQRAILATFAVYVQYQICHPYPSNIVFV